MDSPKMLSLPPPPPPLITRPSPPPPLPLPPFTRPSRQLSMQSPLNQMVVSKQAMNQQLLPADVSKQAMNQQLLPADVPYSCKIQPLERPILKKPRRTNLLVWFCAILCLLFSLVLILFGIGTLIIFLSVKPRIPVFDTPAASLNLVYLNSLEFLNGDLTFIANFSNPNKKLDVRFEYLQIELYFSDSVIATQALQPFIQRQRETRMVPVHLISSLVYLPPNLALQLQKQVQSNRIVYNIRGTFRVRVNLGIIHLSYWLHGRCQLELTSPPNGVLVTHSCRTKR